MIRKIFGEIDNYKFLLKKYAGLFVDVCEAITNNYRDEVLSVDAQVEDRRALLRKVWISANDDKFNENIVYKVICDLDAKAAVELYFPDTVEHIFLLVDMMKTSSNVESMELNKMRKYLRLINELNSLLAKLPNRMEKRLREISYDQFFDKNGKILIGNINSSVYTYYKDKQEFNEFKDKIFELANSWIVRIKDLENVIQTKCSIVTRN